MIRFFPLIIAKYSSSLDFWIPMTSVLSLVSDTSNLMGIVPHY